MIAQRAQKIYERARIDQYRLVKIEYDQRHANEVCTHHIEWLWQKSKAEMICRKNLRASLGVRRPFFTR